MPKIIRIANVDFNANFFNSYMRNIFGESFAHSSLSFEKVFNEGKKYTQQLNEFANEENSTYSYILNNGNEEELKLLEQRYNEVAQALHHFGMPTRQEQSAIGDNETPTIESFYPYFQGAIRPYRNKVELEQARKSGKLTGASYEEETVYDRVRLLYQIITKKVIADNEARNLKKGNNEAFAYALTLDELTIPEIIKINSLVNNETGLSTGFKRIDNCIIGSTFSTCPKELVPNKIQELLYIYNNEWAKEIPSFIEGINTEEEKINHLKAICEREAKFHIQFERIHPFEDGNGRTGRIILNRNLIANKLAPILITPEMHDIYIKCIAEYDYKTLGDFIYLLSSVTLTEMISAYRKAKGIDPDELGLSEQLKTPKNTRTLVLGLREQNKKYTTAPKK